MCVILCAYAFKDTASCSYRRGLAEVWMAKQSHVHFDSQICGSIKINYLDLRSILWLGFDS